jgi:hypothetical protein
VTLDNAANIAELIGGIVVLGGLAFAIVQLAQLRRQRRDLAAIELARSFSNPAFAGALQRVLALQPGLTVHELEQLDDESRQAMMLLSLTFESVGIMVYRRIVDIDIVWDLMGGVVLTTWERLRPWAMLQRELSGREKFDEWIEWLDGELVRYEETHRSEPAFRANKKWRL